MASIVTIQLEHLRKLLADRKIGLELDRSALEWLANEGYDSTYGARPLKRVIQRSLQNPLASLILEGAVKEATRCTCPPDHRPDDQRPVGRSGVMLGGGDWPPPTYLGRFAGCARIRSRVTIAGPDVLSFVKLLE